MGQERGVPQVKWFFLIPRFLNEVVDRLKPIPSNDKALVTMARPASRLPFGHTMREATTGVVALPPFAALVRQVAVAD